MGRLGLGDLQTLLGWVRLAMRTVTRTGRSLAAVVLGLALLQGALGVGLTIATANVIGAAPGVGRLGLSSPAGSRLLTAIIAYVAMLTFQGLVGSMGGAVAPWLTRQLDGRLRERVMRAALRPAGIRHLEDETMRQALEQARTAAPTSGMTPGVIAAVLPSVIGYRIRLLGYLAGLTYLSWPLGLAFLLVTLKSQDEMQKAVWRVAGGGGGRPPAPVEYQLELATTPAPGKEVRVFGLGGWIAGRYREGTLAHIKEVWAKRRDFTPSLSITLAVSAVLNVVALIVLGNAAIAGHLGVGELVFAVVAITALSPAFNQDDMPLAFAAKTIETIEAAERAVEDPTLPVGGALPATAMPHHSISFDGVSFRYPGTESDVLRGIDLDLRTGQRTALVGLNGAGKTTLVKLLCGLYEPTQGRIVVDGTDLRELDPTSWWEQLAVLFQDFLQLELSARDNVRYGAVGWAAPDVEAALGRAAAWAGIDELVAALPEGWDSTLASGYAGGSALSGGQWQRVGLARVLFAVESGARVLVLDEPTANLDVRAEADFYGRLLDLTSGALPHQGSGLATLLISHRFSTVRQADRIVVLDGGHVAEDGTHDELIALDGAYARMFRAQAEQYLAADGSGGEAP